MELDQAGLLSDEDVDTLCASEIESEIGTERDADSYVLYVNTTVAENVAVSSPSSLSHQQSLIGAFPVGRALSWYPSQGIVTRVWVDRKGLRKRDLSKADQIRIYVTPYQGSPYYIAQVQWSDHGQRHYTWAKGTLEEASVLSSAIAHDFIQRAGIHNANFRFISAKELTGEAGLVNAFLGLFRR